MQTIIYAGDQYITGDEIADALLAYSRALGDEERAELVEIPVRDSDGSVRTAKFLIGPASQIVVKSMDAEGPELEDPALVQKLHGLTRNVESPPSHPMEFDDDPEDI
nr:hypothetical protein [Microbacterium hydrocarbonoxydans]